MDHLNSGTLNISIGDSSHAQHFLDIRGGNADPLNQGWLAPKRVDPTTPGRSYELPSMWAEWLEEVAIPGSGNVK